jgi:hypothetical protein
MVPVHRAFGYRFVISLNDHAPAHVHVVGNGSEAKVQLDGPHGLELVWQHGFGQGEMRRVMDEVLRERARLLERWREIHG